MKRAFYFSILVLFGLSAGIPLRAQVKPETMRQIQLLLAEKSSRSPVQQKIASQLLQGVRESRGQTMAKGVNLEPAQFKKTGSGSIEIDITAEVSDELLAKMRAAGAIILFSSAKFSTIRAQVSLSMVEAIAAYPAVRFIQPAVQAQLEGSGAPQSAKDKLKNAGAASLGKSGSSPYLPKVSVAQRQRRVKEIIKKYLQDQNDYNPLVLHTGPVNSQGDRSHRADDARNAYGYAGQGIKIGVLSDTYNALGAAAADVAAGELPGAGNPYGNTTPVTVVSDLASGTDEGRAMMQIVHDIAPKAQLFYATAFGGDASFAQNILTLRNTYGCDIIIDDVGYFNEPAFQDGIIAQAVNTVTAAGALYFSSAANSGSLAMGTAGVYEGDFNDAGSPAFTFPNGTKSGTIHNFGSTPANGDSIIAVASGVYNLQWSDPWGASSNDYDLFLVNAAGTVKASSTTVQSGTQSPYEAFAPPTLVAGDRLIVFKTSTAAVRALHLNSNRGRLKVATNGQTHGHSSAVDAYSVAAAAATGAPYVSTNVVESFSSDGLRRIFFNANGTAITQGNVLFSTNGGIVRNKPDITAADGVSTTLPPASGLNPFFGTSAAAPHAGAIAALIKSASPSITPAQIRSLLTSTALDIQTAGYDNLSGFGIVQAFQSMQSLNPAALPYINVGTTTISEGSYSNGNGSVDPGEIGNLVVQLRNGTMANANNASATITTTTPGVSIVRGTVAYGNINALANASNTSLPFTFAVNASVACGTTITFQIRTTFDGGVGSTGAASTVVLGLQTLANVSSTLGGTPPTGANYTVTSGQQTGRLVRGATASTCAAPVANPGLTVTTGARQYDAYTFTNNTSASQCYTVTVASSNGLNIYTAAYNSGGFVPANPSTNYLAVPGQSSANQVYSFTVSAGATFTVVVHDVNVIPASNSPYSLSVTYVSCAARPACTPVTITTTSIANGATGTRYVQRFTATGASGSYSYSITGNLPAGLTLAGDSLSGTPTQAGSFPITVTANDLTGCPGGSANFTLVIAGNAPASVAATAGTPQSTRPTAVFATPLQATVYDASNTPLSGVNVLFTAPATGPSGTFAGGTTTATAVTNASGVATAPAFTANATQGTYTVMASVNGVSTTANFILTNACPATVVTTNADSGPGSLRTVLANACAGSTITFNTSVTAIALTTGEIPITQSVIITGNGANLLSISGSNLSRIFNMTAGTVSISGLTIKDGKPQSGSLTSNVQNGGGGILVAGGSLALVNCVLSNNDASLTGYQEGGGLDNENAGTVSISGCSFIGNRGVQDGGGIANWGSGGMTITNTTVSGNVVTGAVSTTPNGWGGGIFSNTALTLTNSTIYGNTGYELGGNVERSSGTLTMGNTLIGNGTLTAPSVTAASGFDYYGTMASSGYNLIQNVGGYTISGTTTGNQLGVNPRVFALANYGGPTPTHLLQSSSPAVNAGNPALTTGNDQRGGSRYVGGRADIGAVETNYASSITAGTPQMTAINTPFATALRATITESGNAIAGDSIVFTAPATGASGTFAGSSLTATVVTNTAGVATAPTFTANGTVGTYVVSASLGAAFTALSYNLENTTPLPIVFGDVNARLINCGVQLDWKVLSEMNSKYFAIEYSTNGLRYSDLAMIPSQGNSTAAHSYSYTHNAPAKGMVYYRIRQVDADNSVTYSKVLTAFANCDKVFIAAYPNPIKDKLTVQLSSTSKQTVSVYDAAGRLMTQLSVGAGSHVIDAKGWAKGMYTLTVLQDGKTTYTAQVVKE